MYFNFSDSPRNSTRLRPLYILVTCVLTLSLIAADNNRWEQAAGGVTDIGLLKMPPDSTQNFLVYDQRI